MNVSKSKQNCSGCTACVHICPINCIEMVSDDEGFLYPLIDMAKCIKCNKCIKICPFANKSNNESIESEDIDYYALKHNNENVRWNSSSGGFFTAITDKIIYEGGVIVGAAFDNNFKLSHDIVEDQNGRDRFRGSKYVQSDLGSIFVKIEKLLLESRKVLFSGTPCQVDGLKSFLEKDYENLITIDFICHGVPSPVVFRDYLNFVEQKYQTVTKSINFRDKVTGWHKFSFTHEFTNMKKSEYFDKNSFCSLFSEHYILRPSCHNCVYCSYKRVSDFTMADFWGIENINLDFDDDKGVSLVFANNKRAKKLFNGLSNDVKFCKVSKDDCLQPNLVGPSTKSDKRNEFWNDYKLFGYEYVAKKYTVYGFKNKIKSIIANVLNLIGLYDLVRRVLKR